jgi:Tfp pilus assembly protein PilW
MVTTTTPRTRRAWHAGFSSTEVLLTIVIMSIVCVCVSPIFFQSVAAYAISSARARVVYDARNALMQIQREMLLVTTASITGIQPDQFSFIDSNALATNYRFIAGNPGSIQRGNTLVMPNANGLTFTYLDSNGAQTAVIANVRRINIQLVGQAPGQGTLTLRSEIFPRRFVYQNFQ